MHPRTAARVACFALLLAPALAGAVDIGEGKLTLHGAGGWAYARTDENFYYADDDGDFEHSRFDLSLSARPADQLVVSAQLGFEPRDVALAWAFAEWRFSDAARLRIGQVLQPLGNYAELRFVGTARPFFELPTSVYGPADIGAVAYYGAGVTGDLPLGGSGWALQYDAYAGAIDLDVYEPFEALLPGADPTTPVEHESVIVENVVGARLSLTTPVGIVVRASGYLGSASTEGNDEEAERAVGGLSVLYRGERLWLSIEGFGLSERDSETQLSAYAEAAFSLTEHLQVAARYELTRTDLEGVPDGSPLLDHDEVAVGLNFWFDPNLVLKVSAHRVEGTRFVAPADDATAVEEETNLVFAGAQFTF